MRTWFHCLGCGLLKPLPSDDTRKRTGCHRCNGRIMQRLTYETAGFSVLCRMARRGDQEAALWVVTRLKSTKNVRVQRKRYNYLNQVIRSLKQDARDTEERYALLTILSESPKWDDAMFHRLPGSFESGKS